MIMKGNPRMWSFKKITLSFYVWVSCLHECTGTVFMQHLQKPRECRIPWNWGYRPGELPHRYWESNLGPLHSKVLSHLSSQDLALLKKCPHSQCVSLTGIPLWQQLIASLVAGKQSQQPQIIHKEYGHVLEKHHFTKANSWEFAGCSLLVHKVYELV